MEMMPCDNLSSKNNELLLQNELDLITELNYKNQIDLDFYSMVSDIIASLRKRISFDVCNFAFVDEEGFLKIHDIKDDNVPVNLHSPEVKEYLKRVYQKKHELKHSQWWYCIVAREGKELYYPEIKLNEFNKDEAWFLNYAGVSSVFYLPIKIEGKILGSAGFANYHGKSLYLSEFEKNLIRRRMIVIARAVENSRLYNQIKEQKRKLEESAMAISEDLALARKIQETLIPKTIPSIPSVVISMCYSPMMAVGGDFYDYHLSRKDEGSKLGLIITDASGHGVSAAFITSMIKMAFNSDNVRKNLQYPSEVLMILNRELINKISNNFVTAMYVYFDFEQKLAKLACAGHTPMLIYNRISGEYREVHPKGRFLGFLDNPEFEIFDINIKSGDRFLLYTDGLTEAIDINNIMFEDKLKEIFKSNCDIDIQSLIDNIITQLNLHCSKPEDDVAIIGIDFG